MLLARASRPPANTNPNGICANGSSSVRNCDTTDGLSMRAWVGISPTTRSDGVRASSCLRSARKVPQSSAATNREGVNTTSAPELSR
ncbi:Uncharacterised protein [Mycobacteroides abscessus subsp. abscessus]|nr:Uncharacterised protein [Mycobacteroides abscessus subsp. abscessus]